MGPWSRVVGLGKLKVVRYLKVYLRILRGKGEKGIKYDFLVLGR